MRVGLLLLFDTSNINMVINCWDMLDFSLHFVEFNQRSTQRSQQNPLCCCKFTYRNSYHPNYLSMFWVGLSDVHMQIIHRQASVLAVGDPQPLLQD